MDKGITVYFPPDDVAELREFIKWKTKKAATKNAALNFSNDDFNVENSLRETTDLIQQARQEMAKERERKLELERHDAHVAQQRNSISGLDNRNAEAQQKIWKEEARIQGEEFAKSRNSGASGKAYITEEERSIRDGIISWIDRQRKRGHKM
jgi:hypothetical protein